MSQKRACNNCEFWAELDKEKGECGMVTAPESIVAITPIIRTGSKGAFEGTSEHDPRFSGIEFSASMITPHDFCCTAWQERTWNKNHDH